MTLPDTLAVTALAPGRYTAHVPDGWQQGRGAFGGLVLGVLARAMTSHLGDPSRPLRVLSGEIPAPILPGDHDVRVESFRAGSGVTTLASRIVLGDEVIAHATGVFARDRIADREWPVLTAPALPPFERVSRVVIGAPTGPVFAQHFEYRPTGPMPFAGGDVAEAEGWIVPAAPGATWDASVIVAIMDAWWPASYARETAPRPMATIAFTLEITAPIAMFAKPQPLAYRARGVHSHAGFVTEFRELWTADGTLVALNQQTFVIIK